ncbi:Coactosin-like protein, partial [Goodea atripinnis]
DYKADARVLSIKRPAEKLITKLETITRKPTGCQGNLAVTRASGVGNSSGFQTFSGSNDGRLFGFVRFTTGDAMSKRAKFTLITWIGENVSGLQRAKISTDKTLVKDVVQNFAKEFMISDPRELEEEYLRMELKKAGGANYDAQAE